MSCAAVQCKIGRDHFPLCPLASCTASCVPFGVSLLCRGCCELCIQASQSVGYKGAGGDTDTLQPCVCACINKQPAMWTVLAGWPANALRPAPRALQEEGALLVCPSDRTRPTLTKLAAWESAASTWGVCKHNDILHRKKKGFSTPQTTRRWRKKQGRMRPRSQ